MNTINVAQLRKENHLTQEQLARIIGVSRQTIKNWEAGKPIPSTSVMKLNEVFNSGSPLVANNIQGNNSQNSETVVLAFIDQLKEKDKQIDRLLGIIENISK